MIAQADAVEPARIIIVEDEVSLQRDLVEYLNYHGHSARGVSDGRGLDRLLGQGGFDLAILDVGLPGEDGFAIARRLRDASDIGIIMLTARGAVDDRICGLERGADAYLVKPVDLREVEAQVRGLLRRVRRTGASSEPGPETAGETDGWIFDMVSWELRTPLGAGVKLTAGERALLGLLARRPAQAVSRDEIFKVLGKPHWAAEDRSVDALVRRLRLKVQQQTGERLPLQSVRAVGYVFASPIDVR